MIFDRFRKKKKTEEPQEGYAPLAEAEHEKSAVDYAARRTRRADEKAAAQTVRKNGRARHHVVELCEDIIDASRELEHARNEYRQVTAQLNDIAAIEAFSDEDREFICDTVRQIEKLDETRSELLVSEKKLTDSQFAQMQEGEAEIPHSVSRLKSNETYLDAIKRDMNFLEGEKVEWSILRQECEHEQVILRRLALFLSVIFSLTVLILFVIRLYMDYDIQLFLLLAAFITTLIGVYVLLKYQDCTREIRRCDVNRNQAILLQNRVKMKYVNIKNAVDYTCDKYNVKNSYELTYMYEQFQSAVREQEKFRQTSDDLTYYTTHLTDLLEKQRLSDPSYWAHCMRVFIDKKEMKAQKGSLIARKQTLRKNIEESMASIDEMKKEVTESTRYMGEVSVQVQQILQKIDEINQPL